MKPRPARRENNSGRFAACAKLLGELKEGPLEDAATEFQVQGLEVDWACVTWDADLRLVDGGRRHHSFRGDVWTNVNKPDRQRCLLNAYRVLLTRARQGMAIFVPPGDRRDQTRLPQFYDGTFEYLTGIGLAEV